MKLAIAAFFTFMKTRKKRLYGNIKDFHLCVICVLLDKIFLEHSARHGDMILHVHNQLYKNTTQPAFTCLKSTMETRKQCVKNNLKIKTPEQHQ